MGLVNAQGILGVLAEELGRRHPRLEVICRTTNRAKSNDQAHKHETQRGTTSACHRKVSVHAIIPCHQSFRDWAFRDWAFRDWAFRDWAFRDWGSKTNLSREIKKISVRLAKLAVALLSSYGSAEQASAVSAK